MAECVEISLHKSTLKEKFKTDQRSRNSSFILESMKLKAKQDHLDKAQAIAVKNLRCLDNSAGQDVGLLYKEMEWQRLRDSERLHYSVLSVLQSFKQLKNDIRNEDRLRQLDLENYQKSIFDLENEIRALNETNSARLKKLIEEESIVSNELQRMKIKCDEWAQPVNTSVLKPTVTSISKSCISNTDTIRQEVLAFRKFLQDTGGHTGGWDEEDHLLFLRLRNIHKRKVAFLSLLQQHLPDISADELLLHEEWYQQYETLRIKQKEAIQEWRSLKSESQHNDVSSKSVNIDQRNKAKYQGDSEEKKKKIEEWKKTLQLKKELEDKKQWENKQKELEREQKRREMQECKKAEVEHYKEEKLNQQQTKLLVKQLKELHEMEERATQANVLRKVFREQDKMFITRRLNRREQVILKEEQRQKHLQNMKQKVGIDRDPKRLYSSTASWREHCKRKSEASISEAPVPLLHLRNMPHLQVPSWRKGLK